jgi:RNA recognition motif-containing protein
MDDTTSKSNIYLGIFLIRYRPFIFKYPNALQQQRATAAAALLYQQQQQSLFSNHSQDNHNAFQTAITADDPYIRVRNIPVGYSYYNIKLLFSKYKLNLSDIKILNDQNGQRTGEIVLRLHTNKDVSDLLSQDGRIQCFNSMLDIKKIDEYTFASAIDSFIPAHVKKTPGTTIKNCIRVTGLPKTYERKDVKRFFTGCNVTNRPGGIFIEADTVNGPTFVEFDTEIDAEKAFFYNGEQMGKSNKFLIEKTNFLFVI